MFERDLHGLNPQLPTNPFHSGTAHGRHEIARRDYLERKRARLTLEAAEADARLRQSRDEAQVRAMADALYRLTGAVTGLFRLVRRIGGGRAASPSLRRRAPRWS